MAEMLAGSQMVPKNYQGKPQDALVAMMMGSELGLNPIQSLANVAVINGKPAIYGDALLALVQNHPKFGGHEESFEESGMVATCTVWRKGDATKHTVTFSQADARKAGLWEKSGPWTQYPKRMLMWRARGYALRDKFADALGGLITVEEARDIPEQDMGVASRAPQSQESEGLANKWIGRANTAGSADDLSKVWKDGLAEIKSAGDMKAYGEFKNAVATRGERLKELEQKVSEVAQ
jgi:hypothetical protein